MNRLIPWLGPATRIDLQTLLMALLVGSAIGGGIVSTVSAVIVPGIGMVLGKDFFIAEGILDDGVRWGQLIRGLLDGVLIALAAAWAYQKLHVSTKRLPTCPECLSPLATGAVRCPSCRSTLVQSAAGV